LNLEKRRMYTMKLNFCQHIERRKNSMLSTIFSKLAGVTFFMVFLALFVFPIANGANAGVTDIRPSSQGPITTEADDFVVGFWDLRDRESFFQVTNVSGAPIAVHVQIWNASEPGMEDRCVEFDFPDNYTGNDTHIYNIRDLKTNNLSEINPPPLTDGHGYIYVSVTGAQGCTGDKVIIASQRIIDVPGGYEYRSAALGVHDDFHQRIFDGVGIDTDTYGFNFNSVDGASFADVVPVVLDVDDAGGVCSGQPLVSGLHIDTVTTAEVRQSCPPREVGCKLAPDFGQPQNPVLVDVGINNALVNSRGLSSLCSDTTENGWTLLQYSQGIGFNDVNQTGPCFDAKNFDKLCAGFVGINNGDGTGSMESWTALDRRNAYFDLIED
jgi:hypothetical protein